MLQERTVGTDRGDVFVYCLALRADPRPLTTAGQPPQPTAPTAPPGTDAEPNPTPDPNPTPGSSPPPDPNPTPVSVCSPARKRPRLGEAQQALLRAALQECRSDPTTAPSPSSDAI